MSSFQSAFWGWPAQAKAHRRRAGPRPPMRQRREKQAISSATFSSKNDISIWATAKRSARLLVRNALGVLEMATGASRSAIRTLTARQSMFVFVKTQKNALAFYPPECSGVPPMDGKTSANVLCPPYLAPAELARGFEHQMGPVAAEDEGDPQGAHE